ncbi:class I SAM-dependent methyltransferase, partial [Escherichia coli]|uniref:class I SAM-dependent methyltransferase n=1 Tax=Escherichia coli TaxID=562 RepID=UPI00333823E8
MHGYDPSTVSLARAKERAPGAQLHTDTKTLPKDYFATAVLSGVLHHVQPSARVDLLRTVHG